MAIRTIEKKVANCYSTWGTTYFEEYYGKTAAYPPVHLDLVKSLVKKYRPQSILDAGCGPASMLRELRRLVPNRFGFDLTDEMVAEGKRVMVDQGESSVKIWKGSVTSPKSFVSPESKKYNPYPMILCVGVLPHIPENKEHLVLKNIHQNLSDGGVAVIEARNELFSLFTLNRFSHDFFVDSLIGINNWRSSPTKSRIVRAIDKELKKSFRMDLPPIRKGKKNEPGYDEVLARLHNPIVFREKLLTLGFRKVELQFYHYHCIPPRFQKLLKGQFRTESLKLEGKNHWQGYFMASAFLAVATR